MRASSDCSHHQPHKAFATASFALISLLLGYALRIHRLGVKSIWWDEAHSWWYARMPLLDGIREGMAAWHGAAGDPLFTVMLHTWISLVGDSAFAMRYLSALIGLLTVAYLGRMAARVFGWQTGRVALLLGAIAPIWVFYSQEVRQYALTPGITLIMVDAVLRIARERRSALSEHWDLGGPWIHLILGEALALYTHSFLVFAVAAINVWLLWLWLRDFRGAAFLRAWVLSQLAVLLLIAPTLSNYFRRLQAGHSPFVAPLSIPHILNAQWSLVFGIPWQHATEPVAMRLFLGAILILMLPLLALALRRLRSRLLADLVWWITLADALTLLYWSINPVLHPRYMLFLTGPLFAVLSASIVSGRQRGSWFRAMSLVLVLSLVLLSSFSLHNLYTGRLLGYRHDPASQMTAILRQEFTGRDGIITIDPNDYTVWYYGFGEAELFRAGLDDGDHTPADLVEFIRGKDRIAVVQFHAEQSDKRRIIPFYLERFGALDDVRLMESYGIYTYQMDADSSPALAQFEPASYTWGSLLLVGQSIQSGDAVTVALRWQASPTFDTDSRYASIIRLVDPETGWLLGSVSSLILSDQGYPTSEWSPGEQATQYYVLPLVPGTPPIEVEASVTLVDSVTAQALDLQDSTGAPAGQRASLGSVALTHTPARWLYDIQPPFTFAPLPTDLLAGYAADWPTTAPGGTVGLTLSWLIAPGSLADHSAHFDLRQGDQVLASEVGLPLQGRTPADTQPWLDRRVLHVSGEAQPGPADLVLLWDNELIRLGQIEILGFQRFMEPPAIKNPLDSTFGASVRLIGYHLDVPDPLTSANTLTLTLYWEALTDGLPGADYTVFAQILDESGRLVGQHDGVPVYNTRPTSGWLTGEYLIDMHSMTFREPYIGPIRIQVGLYDPVTLRRLLTDEGQDAVVLPLELVVESAP